MTINALNAANAYRNQLKMMEGVQDTPEQTGEASFSKMLESAVQDSIDTQYSTEATKLEALVGNKVDLTDLVAAVSSAELTLNTVVAVRDRVINAYQEILRMPI